MEVCVGEREGDAISMWIVWTKSQALARMGNGWTDLYQNKTWSYHSAHDMKEAAEVEARKVKTKPDMEEWIKLDIKGPSGLCVQDAICRPVGHNPNWET